MEQNYKNHRRLVTGYHKVLALLLLIGFIGSIVNLSNSFQSNNLYSAILLVFLFICLMFITFYVRSFPLKAQDRTIRAEENFRHYILTGKQISPYLSMGQIIALRFAPDEEFAELAQRAEKENLSDKAIKQIIKTWKADHYRV